MPATCPAVDAAEDLAHPERWERSRERSYTRRLRALRRRRRQRGSRSLVAVLVAALTLGAGGAFAASTDGGVLKKGSSGPAVVQVQKKLGIPADGAFGPQTEKAVRRFQGGKGLEVDGVVGPQTARALGVSLATAQAQSRSALGLERAVAGDPEHDRRVRVRRRPDRDLARRHLPRQVPVRPLDVGRLRLRRRPGARL